MFTKTLLTVFVFLCAVCNAGAQGLPHRVIEGVRQPSLAPIVEQAVPAVVNISTYTVKRNTNPLLQSPFFRHFFAIPEEMEESKRMQSAGSGVIVDAVNGYVLTNHHVVADADGIEVNLQDGRSLPAKLIGSDRKVDISLLQIQADNLKALPIANSRDLAVGDFVVAIGNPFGIGQTVTSGIISALGRNSLGIQGYEDFIQTDASINPGNSGGALIDMNGRLIGINSAIIAPAGGNVGIGFAIPIEVASSVMDQLIRYGEVRRGSIGAQFQDLTPELADAFGLKTFQGAVIARVAEGSAAADAGLQVGDIVTAADKRPVRNASDLYNRIGLSAVGHKLELDILHQGRKQTKRVEVRPIPVPQAAGSSISRLLSGTQLKDLLPPGEEQSVGILLESVEPGSYAANLGFTTGDILFGVNRTRTRSIADLARVLASQNVRMFQIRRGYEDLLVYVR